MSKVLTDWSVVRKALSFCLFTSLLLACETDAYEKGTGEYSLMRADLAEATIDADKQAVSITTDDGDHYTLSPVYTGKWILTSDTTYRVAAYYNPHDDGTAEPLSMGVVPTLIPREVWRYKKQPQDPVGVESMWLSKSGKYLNMGLLLKSGQTEDEKATQIISLAQDTIVTHADHKRTAVYRLLHDQGGIPEYYTNRHYVSVLIPKERPDTIDFIIQTYQGTLRKKIPVSK
jgi:hypothetical protein